MSHLIEPPPTSEPVVISTGPHSFAHDTSAIYVGGAGVVVCHHVGDATARTYSGVPAGTYLIGAFGTVYSAGSGTTATFMIGEYPPCVAHTGP